MAYEATTDNFQIRNANKVTFVGTSNTIIDTTTGRIQTKGFQHNSNVITDISGPHGRVASTLKKYPEIIFEEGKFDRNDSTNTYVQAGYTVSASSVLSPSYTPWRIFDDVLSGNDGWATPNHYNSSAPGEAQSTLGATQFPTASGRYGEYVDLQLPHGIKVKNFVIKTRPTQSGSGAWMPENSPGTGYLYGSNDGTNWTEIKAFSGLTYGGMTTNGGTQETIEVNSTVAYKYVRLQATNRAGQRSSDQYLAIGALEYYGYEEYTPAGDHSVDTTFMSRFNNPQLTGVRVLVDGGMANPGTNQISGGADPSGNNSIYDATNKYYTLNGTITSNLSVESNTFLEGDQPHAVSVWFNSSNLEANVSNTCVFSISDQEKLDSLNLDLQSNTWHNLTYAYQGEGGSKVTYLDGRKVAEDQAEDTFGEYPPFAMTGYAQGGYVVSAVEEYDVPGGAAPNYLAWEAFDGDTNSASGTGYWSSKAGAFATSSPYGTLRSGGAFVTNVGGTDRTGLWIQLELPHKLKLNLVKYQYRSGSSGLPRTGFVVGSNNGTTWEQIYAFENLTASSTTVAHPLTPNGSVSNIAYKYIRLIITHGGGGEYAAAQEIQLYGHRENDLVRLPDPTNVLKYPHIAMTGPVQRGYAVTASAQETASQSWEAFDESVETNTSGWIWNTGGTHNLGTDSGSGTATDGGHWIRLELPHKLAINRVEVISDAQNPQGQDEFPDEYAIYGWNASGTWTKLLDVTGKNPTLGTSTTFSDTISNSTAYKHIALVAKSYYNNSTSYARIAEIKYYGTEEDTSIPIQIGGGNIDKVANFRVYDKFVGEDQALEIWDAQKDYFGRAKSSMTLHKGRLGIGTTEPTSILDVRGTFQGNSPLRFFVLTGTFPTSGITQDVTVLPQDLINRISNIVSMNGLTINSDGDQVNWNQNGSTSWEVDIKADVSVPKFILSGFDASHVNISGKKWRMFIVTT